MFLSLRAKQSIDCFYRGYLWSEMKRRYLEKSSNFILLSKMPYFFPSNASWRTFFKLQGKPSALQKNIQLFKTWNIFFSYLGAILALLGPYFHLLALTIPDITEVPMSSVVDSDPYSAYYLIFIWYGSGFLFDVDPCATFHHDADPDPCPSF